MFDLFGAFQKIEFCVCLMWGEREGVLYIASQSIIKGLSGNDINLRLPAVFNSVQLLSHVQLFVTLWTAACQDSLSILELAQIHVHRVSDTIQPSHPLSSPSPAFSLSQHQGLFQWVSFS